MTAAEGLAYCDESLCSDSEAFDYVFWVFDGGDVLSDETGKGVGVMNACFFGLSSAFLGLLSGDCGFFWSYLPAPTGAGFCGDPGLFFGLGLGLSEP